MAMAESLDLVQATLQAGMTTGHEDDLYYVKTWYVNSKLEFEVSELPLAVIKPEGEQREDQYVQEDTEIDNVNITFFPAPVSQRMQVDTANQANVRMIDQASRLLRADPTQGQQVYDTKVLGSTFNQPGFVGAASFHSAVLRVQLKQRELW